MLQKINAIKFLIAVFAVIFSFNLSGAAQSDWLDMKPLPSWNERSRAILETKKISKDELTRCSIVVRQPTLPQDRLLTKMGWTLVGPAQIYGNTTVVSWAQSFDGMCRPLGFQTLVFVGNRVAGTLSPGPMDSRTDGYLTNIKLTTEKNLTAYYARYREADALCCPSKTEAVTFTIKPDGKNFLLVPEEKIETSADNNSRENQQSDMDMPKDAKILENVVWRWENLQTSNTDVKVDKAENYTLQFMADGKIRVLADCNRGGGSYKSDGKSLKFSAIFTTKMACPPGSLDNRFLRSLESAQSYEFADNKLLIELNDGGTMQFSRVASGDKTSLENTVWRWQESENSTGKITVDKPENYQIKFNPNGELEVKADCNGGGAKYKPEGTKLMFSAIIRTQIFCGEDSLDTRFVRGLEQAATFKITGNNLLIEGAGDNDTMKFFRVSKQN